MTKKELMNLWNSLDDNDIVDIPLICYKTSNKRVLTIEIAIEELKGE